MFYDFVNLYWNNLNFEYFICSTFNNLGFNSRVKNGRNLSKFYFKYYNRTILNLTRDQILILFKQLYNKSNCFSRDWQSFLILFISFFFFFYFPCNLISRTKMKLQRNLARVSLFRTKHVRANSDRSKLCTVYRTELVNLFWWSLYLECTNDDFEAGFMDSSWGNSRMICDRLRISSVPYISSSAIKIRFVENWSIAFKKYFNR